MRKHNEGYTLAMVLVVLLVLEVLVGIILTNSMRNLKIQEVAVQRMSDKYAVEGELERIVARLETALTATASNPVEVVLEDSTDVETQLYRNYDVETQLYRNYMVIAVRSNQVQLGCILELTGAAVVDQGKGKYEFSALKGIQYEHYEISTVEEVAVDDGEPENYTGTIPKENIPDGSTE